MKHQRRRGSILILTILLTTAGVAWTSVGLTRSGVELDTAQRDVASYQAFQLAEAGLDQVVDNLRTIDGNDDIFTGTLASGGFVIDQPLTVLQALTYEAHIHGQADTVQRDIEAVLVVTPLSIFRYAMFGDDNVTIGGSTWIDSYDSRDGPYDLLTNANGNGDIGTNSAAYGGLDLNGSSLYIDGQLSIGPNVATPEGQVDGFDASLVSGDPPVVSVPEYPLPGVTIPAGVTCNDLKLTGNVTFTLPSPGTYCFDELEVMAGAHLTSNGPVTIYLTTSLDFSGNSTIGVVNDPTQFLFLVASGSSVNIQGSITGSSELYGAMYGPDATFDIAGDAIIYGSVIGNEVHMTGDAQLHYDEALAEMDTLSNEGIVELRSWRTE